ncbi:MAG TPA: hypothetical protein VNN17_01530, partial [Terriglobia bacterium]|nr:hypothetical protein [Terriglobia bacterium]
LAMALVPAMAMNEPLEIEDAAPVSPKLLQAADQVQEVLHCWEPLLAKIPICCRLAEAKRGSDAVGSFFSGGVDGSYTFARHADEISHLVFIRGYDIPHDNQSVFATAQEEYGEFARRGGKRLAFVDTNRQQLNRDLLGPLVGKKNGFTSRHIIACRSQSSGTIMASVGLALGFPRFYIATGVTYCDMSPYAGLSPVLDRLWRTEATEFIHDGMEAHRNEKLAYLFRVPELMKFLRVCRQGGAYNCGRCSKCLRTMIPLRLLGLSAPTLPPLRSLRPLRKLWVHGPEELLFYEDNLRLAEQKGDRRLARILRSRILWFHLRQHLKLADRLLFRESGRRAIHGLRGMIPGRARPAPEAAQ